MPSRIIDAHAHCGIQDTSMAQSFADYCRHIKESPIEAAVMFPPVQEIYDRTDPRFEDTPEWIERRNRANEYLLTLSTRDFQVIPYLFIWNDFAVERLKPEHQGIKWHRHPDEPAYRYDHPRCRKAIRHIAKRNLPVVLEEEFAHTLRFIRELAPDVRVIIPHLGALNGGYARLKSEGVWGEELVFADTSLASRKSIEDYVHSFGPDKLLFGSDFPFGHPRHELEKLEALDMQPGHREKIQGLNLLQLLSTVKPEAN